MSGAPRVRSLNVADSDGRPVFRSLSAMKSTSKPSRKVEGSPDAATVTVTTISPKSNSTNFPSVLRRHKQLLHSSLSLNASCSSDASTDSFHSRASTGRMTRYNSLGSRRKLYASKPRSVVFEGVSDSPPNVSQTKKQCAWVTPNSDPSYAAFHDQEWGVTVHDDKEVFLDFDPFSVSKLNGKKVLSPGSIASSLLSEPKLRAILENARQMCKIIDEFDKYIWSNRPIVPVKTPKADTISKDLARRGFRSVGPTVIYSFMHYQRPSHRLLQVPKEGFVAEPLPIYIYIYIYIYITTHKFNFYNLFQRC